MEEVFVVPARHLPQFQGFMPTDEKAAKEITRHGFFMPRDKAEKDFSVKQIIPYIIFVHGGRIFAMRRLEKSGEERLRGKTSIGIGGHINHVDAGDALAEGMKREFFEEVHYGGAFDPKAFGFINDDSTDVGKVHFGVCYYVIGDSHISVKETDILDGRMLKPDEIETDTMETWSRIALENILKNPYLKSLTN